MAWKTVDATARTRFVSIHDPAVHPIGSDIAGYAKLYTEKAANELLGFTQGETPVWWTRGPMLSRQRAAIIDDPACVESDVLDGKSRSRLKLAGVCCRAFLACVKSQEGLVGLPATGPYTQEQLDLIPFEVVQEIGMLCWMEATPTGEEKK